MRFIIAVYFVVFVTAMVAQNHTEEILTFQKTLNKDYADSLSSPLKKEDRLAFKGHVFYPTNIAYKVTATLKKTPEEKPFKMATTKGQPRDYVKFGEVEFIIHKKKYKLNVYQSLDLVKSEEYKNYLFFPFKDLTNSVETYGGGRFIDLAIPEGASIVIDFNKAYNPYCAYTDTYSCPIVPAENTLPIEIKAGIKGPVNH